MGWKQRISKACTSTGTQIEVTISFSSCLILQQVIDKQSMGTNENKLEVMFVLYFIVKVNESYIIVA